MPKALSPAHPFVFRKVYVVCPRALLPYWMSQPWSEVYQAASEDDNDLLTLHHGVPPLWQGPQMVNGPTPPNVAYLAQGQGTGWEDKTVLFQQNWGRDDE